MDNKPVRRGKIEYLQEGFIVHRDEDVLTVEVIDYHATTLCLPWKDVQALATIASGLPRSKAPKSGSKRNTRPEV